MSREDVVNLLYIVGFALFIAGLRMVRGPRTAVRGNQVAAVGMGIALLGTLLDDRIGDWALIVVGVVVGTAIGIPSARSVKMTAMPQMVALFNGVGGGAVALISLVEYRETGGDLPSRSPSCRSWPGRSGGFRSSPPSTPRSPRWSSASRWSWRRVWSPRRCSGCCSSPRACSA
jgi:hypothetical protein